MKDDWEELHAQVEEIIQILNKYDVQDWRARLLEINHRIAKQWREGPSLFIGTIGGMGSLTDLTIYPENNDKIEIGDVEEVNRTLKDAISRAYVLAKRIEEG